MTNNHKLIYNLTSEIHEEVDNIYEAMMDGEDKEAISLIEKARDRLQSLKNNLVKRDE